MFFVTCAWWSWSYGFRCACQPCHTLVRRFCSDNYALVERFTQHKLEAADIKLFGADCVNGVKKVAEFFDVFLIQVGQFKFNYGFKRRKGFRIDLLSRTEEEEVDDCHKHCACVS